jgi:hypothetical protein
MILEDPTSAEKVSEEIKNLRPLSVLAYPELRYKLVIQLARRVPWIATWKVPSPSTKPAK